VPRPPALGRPPLYPLPMGEIPGNRLAPTPRSLLQSLYVQCAGFDRARPVVRCGKNPVRPHPAHHGRNLRPRGIARMIKGHLVAAPPSSPPCKAGRAVRVGEPAPLHRVKSFIRGGEGKRRSSGSPHPLPIRGRPPLPRNICLVPPNCLRSGSGRHQERWRRP